MGHNFQEYFAKVVLERCFPNRFKNLQVMDKPDLRCGTKIGIEVTNCLPQKVVEAFNLWHRVRKQGDDTPQRIFERLDQLKDTVHLEGDKLIWEQGSYVIGDMENSPIKDFLNAVVKKVERLNSENAKYTNMESYELFVNSFIMVQDTQMFTLLQRLREINSKSKKFDIIYLVTCMQNMFVFNMLNDTCEIKYLYSNLQRMADEAKEIYLKT